MFYVYLLESIPTGKFYIGQTSDIDSRIKRHNLGYEKYTKPYMPWKLLGSIEVQTRSEAFCLERKIKSLKKRELQLKYFQNSPGSEKLKSF